MQGKSHSKGHGARRAMGAVLLAGIAAFNAPALAAQGCDRACLSGKVDSYLTAMVAHDPARAPFASDVKFTENTSAIDLHNGLWATATGVDPYRILVLDPQSAQAAYVGVVREHGRPVLLALRLKVDDGRISEAESVVARDVKNFRNLKTPRQPMVSPLAPDQRVPRAQMIAAANAYFDGIEQGNGNIVPFDADCNRLENGLQTTNNPHLMEDMAAGDAAAPSAPGAVPASDSKPADNAGSGNGSGSGLMGMGCRDQFNSGIFGFISRIDQRRGFVVDEQTGVVFGFFMFNHRGLTTTATLKDGTTMPAPFGGTPWNMQMAELFKLRGGKIWQVEAIGAALPYGAKSGWEQGQ